MSFDSYLFNHIKMIFMSFYHGYYAYHLCAWHREQTIEYRIIFQRRHNYVINSSRWKLDTAISRNLHANDSLCISNLLLAACSAVIVNVIIEFYVEVFVVVEEVYCSGKHVSTSSPTSHYGDFQESKFSRFHRC